MTAKARERRQGTFTAEAAKDPKPHKHRETLRQRLPRRSAAEAT
jgi:hypothetical protein